VFRQTDTGTLTIKVPSGAKSVYTAADWVDAVANGNSGKYGTMHKAVVITDTP
jgi:hypothetical protein